MVIDNQNMSHRPKGLPAQVAGTYDGKTRQYTDTDRLQPIFDQTSRLTTLIEDTLPLNPDRTSKPPVYDPLDDQKKIRIKLGRYLVNNLQPDTDRQQLVDENIRILYPTIQPLNTSDREAQDHIHWLEQKTGQHVYAYQSLSPRVLLFIVDGPSKAMTNRIGYSFVQSKRSLHTMSLADLMATRLITDRMSLPDDQRDKLIRTVLGEKNRMNLTQQFSPYPSTILDTFTKDTNMTFTPCPNDPIQAEVWCEQTISQVMNGVDGQDWSKNMIRRELESYQRSLRQLPLSNAYVNAVRDLFDSERQVMANRHWQQRLVNSKTATVWQDKKNPDPTHVQAARQSLFAQDFTRIEVDDDVDLTRFAQLNTEWESYRQLLPQQIEPATLRFRYTGRHHAYGVYHPFARNIAVDPRHPSSFTHEYFHHLDHTLDSRMLSLDPRFQPIIHRYEQLVDQNQMSGNTDHWLAPTEIFARAAETWMSRHGGDGSSLLKTRGEYETRWEYMPFLGAEQMIDNFMDSLFN